MVLDNETILACSRSASFQRGQKYYLDGRVKQLKSDGVVCEASVIGTARYNVKLNLTTLEGACDCYAFDGLTWCKHMVAVGLAVSQTNVDDDKAITNGEQKNNFQSSAHTLQEMIEHAETSKVSTALKLVADRFPESYDFIEGILNPETFNNEQDILQAAKSYLRPIRYAKDWHRLMEAELLAQEQLNCLTQVVAATETCAKGLLAAAQYVYKQLENIDDSDGILQDACYELCRQAIEIVNKHHDFEPVLYEAMSKSSDLPLEAYLLEAGDELLTEHIISRLDKHILKRDQELANISQDSALYLLMNHFAAKGDKRLLDLLSENPVNKNIKNSAMVTYYESLGEWDEVVQRLWPLKDEYSTPKSLLKRALSETKQFDKLIELQLDETVYTKDIKSELIKLEHLLKQANKNSKLPEITERLINEPRLQLDQRVWILMEQKRFKDISKLLLQALNWQKDQITWSSWSDIANLVSYLNRQLQAVAPEMSVNVWRVLFKQEAEKVAKTTNYLNFQEQGNTLMKLGASKFVRDIASRIIKEHPTRKKLVSICQSWLDTETKTKHF